MANNDHGMRRTYHAMDDLSARMFAALESIVVRARDGQIDRRTAVAEAAQISPKAAKAVDWAMRLNLLMLLLMVIQFAYQYQHDVNVATREERAERSRASYEMKRDAEQLKLAEHVFTLMEDANYTQLQVLEVVKKLDLPDNVASKPPGARNRQGSTEFVDGNRKDRRAAASKARRKIP